MARQGALGLQDLPEPGNTGFGSAQMTPEDSTGIYPISSENAMLRRKSPGKKGKPQSKTLFIAC